MAYQPRNVKWDPCDSAALLDLSNKGLTDSQIAEQLGRQVYACRTSAVTKQRQRLAQRFV